MAAAIAAPASAAHPSAATAAAPAPCRRSCRRAPPLRRFGGCVQFRGRGFHLHPIGAGIRRRCVEFAAGRAVVIGIPGNGGLSVAGVSVAALVERSRLPFGPGHGRVSSDGCFRREALLFGVKRSAAGEGDVVGQIRVRGQRQHRPLGEVDRAVFRNLEVDRRRNVAVHPAVPVLEDNSLPVELFGIAFYSGRARGEDDGVVVSVDALAVDAGGNAWTARSLCGDQAAVEIDVVTRDSPSGRSPRFSGDVPPLIVMVLVAAVMRLEPMPAVVATHVDRTAVHRQRGSRRNRDAGLVKAPGDS